MTSRGAAGGYLEKALALRLLTFRGGGGPLLLSLGVVLAFLGFLTYLRVECAYDGQLCTRPGDTPGRILMGMGVGSIAIGLALPTLQHALASRLGRRPRG